MSQTNASRNFRWTDLSHYGVQLNIFVQEKQSILAVLGSVTPEVKAKLEAMDFVRLPWGTYARKSMENPAQFLQSIKSYFPESRVIQEGDVCADGSIMHMANIVKNIRNQQVVREFGNPFNTQAPEGFVPPQEETEVTSPEIRSAEVETTATVQETTAPPVTAEATITEAPAPEPTAQEPATPEPTATIVAEPVAATPTGTPEISLVTAEDWDAYISQFLTPDGLELSQKGIQIIDGLTSRGEPGTLFSVDRDRLIREATESLRCDVDFPIGGVVKSVDENDPHRDNYKVVVNNSGEVIGFLDMTSVEKVLKSHFIARDNTVFTEYSNGNLRPSIDYGIIGVLYNIDGKRHIASHERKQAIEDYNTRQRINIFRNTIVRPIINDNTNPGISLKGLTSLISGRPYDIMTEDEKRDYFNSACIAIGISRPDGENRLDYYNKLENVSDFMSREVNGRRIPTHIEFAISRAMNIISLPVTDNIFINRDDNGSLSSCIPASSTAKIVVGADEKLIPSLERFIPLGNSNMAYQAFPAPDFEGASIQLINMVGLRDDTLVDVILGEETLEVREDVAGALRYLNTRPDNGQTTILLDATKEETQDILNKLAAIYHINSATEMSVGAMKRNGSQTPMVAISVGVKRALPLQLEDIPEYDKTFTVLEDSRDVWSWSSMTIRKMSENLDIAMDSMADGIERNEDNFNEANNFQEPYASLSHHGSPATMSPKFQITPQRRFHKTIITELKRAGFDSVDDYAVHALGLPLEEINMSPEQIDMLATAFVRFSQDEREGNAIMNADNTGVGKTRENCAIITGALREGFVSTYITEFPAAFGAIYDEFRILKSDNLLRPLTLNNNDITHNGEVIMPATPRHIIKGLTNRMLPPNYGLKMECIILTPEGSNILRSLFKEHLEAYQDRLGDDDFMERYNAIKSLMDKYEGGQITLINNESINDILRFIPMSEIKEQITEYPDYNFILGTYSQFNRPSSSYQKERGRVSLAESYENPAPKGKKKPRIIVKSPKADWMTQVVARQAKHIVTLDESHVAASDNSNISRNVDPLKTYAERVIYSSATWLKGVKGMGLYSRLFSELMPVENISAIMTKGDETIHETITRMMVETGAYVRRELDTSGCTYTTIHDSKYFARNVDYTNLLAPVRSAIAVYANAIKARVSMLNDTVDNEHDIQNLTDGDRTSARAKKIFDGGDISSPLTRLEQTVDVIYIMDIVLDRAINHLKEGRKPFIAIDGTNEGYIRSFFEKNNRIPNLRDLLKNIAKRITLIKHKGDYIDFAESIQHMDIADDIVASFKASLPDCFKPFEVENIESITDEMMNEREAQIKQLLVDEDVKTVKQYISKKLYDIAMDIKESGRYPANKGDMDYLHAIDIVSNAIGEPNTIYRLTQLQNIEDQMPVNPARQIKAIMDLIDKVPELPISALDHIREGIEKAGFTCGEITGRRFFIKDNKEMIQRDIRDKGVIRDMYNDGEYNAVLVNKAGASSLNMHASLEAKDKGVRVTQYCGVFPDANTYGQIAGRTHRNGAISNPEYEVYNTGLPVTIRRLAIMAKKLRSMFALSTSNRDNSLIGSDVIDIMNTVGDTVCFRYLEARPELAERLGLESKLEAAIEAKSENRSTRNLIEAKTVIRLVDNLLPYHEQSKVLQELETEYVAEIDELDAMGKNPLKQKEIHGESYIKDRKLISGFEKAGENQSVFSQPLYLSTLTTITEINPISGDAMAAACEAFEREMTETPAERAEMLWERRDDILFETKGLDKSIHVDDYMSGTTDFVAPPLLKQNYNKLKALCSTLKAIQIGSLTETHRITVSARSDERLNQMVITGIKMPDKDSMEATQASHYQLTLLEPGMEKAITERLQVRMRISENGRLALGMPLTDMKVNIENSGLKSEDPARFIESFQQRATDFKKRNKTGQTNYVLTGNELAAINVGISAGDIGHIVSFKLNEGEDEHGIPRMKQMRGYLITDLKKFDEYNTNIESYDLAVNVLEDVNVGRLEFQSKPKTLVSKNKKGNYSISMPAYSDEGSLEFFENPAIKQFAEAHFTSVEHMATLNSNGRAKTKLVLKVEKDDSYIVNDFIRAMYDSRLQCRYDPTVSDAVSKIREDMSQAAGVAPEENNTPDAVTPENDLEM